MLRALALFLYVIASPALAQGLSVGSGEHGTFTRIVMPIPEGSDWQLVRSPQGYVLTMSATDQRFDLSRAYARIGRNRIAEMSAGGVGELSMTIACSCHAMPFEFRRDMLVIDIRDGAPPPASAFELSATGERLPPLRPSGILPPVLAEVPQGSPPVMDWSADWLRDRRAPPAMPVAAEPLPAIPLDTDDLRATLLLEFSRAAADGMIDPVAKPPRIETAPQRTTAATENLRAGDPLSTLSGLRDGIALTAKGGVCPPDDLLAIETWGDDRPAPLQLADTARTLLGEFDIPDPQALQSYARLHLYLGFGAEALQLMSLYPGSATEEPLFRSLARIVDGFPDPAGPFPALAACDTSAALWAALSDPPRLPPALNRAAALRGFSALPAHLRRHLGPTLGEAFLAADDVPAATTIAEAILRLPGPPDDRTAILSARLALLSGGSDLSESRLRSILSDPGPDQAAALAALVDLHAAEARPIGAEVLPALAAYRTENAGTSAEPKLHRALILAMALSGDFTSAFAEAATRPDLLPDIWRILGSASDEDLLIHAVGALADTAGPEARQTIADRLLALGFAEEARRWSGQAGPIPLPPPQTDPVQTAILARDWQGLPEDAPDAWRSATQAILPADDGSMPPLARARSLAEQSATTRAALNMLLRDVPAP